MKRFVGLLARSLHKPALALFLQFEKSQRDFFFSFNRTTSTEQGA
jgi:hypothetical protein